MKPMQLARLGLDGASWYDLAADSVRKVCGWRNWNPYLFSAVLAATSPRTQVTRNVRNTIHYFETGKLLPGTMRMHTLAVRRLSDGRKHMLDRLSGPKVKPFYEALIGNRDAIVIDTWMLRAFGWDKPVTVTPSRYRYCADRIKRIGRKLSLCPRDTQAAIWCGMIASVGRNWKPMNIYAELVNPNWRPE